MTSTMYIVQNNTNGDSNRNKILSQMSVRTTVWVSSEYPWRFKFFESEELAQKHMDDCSTNVERFNIFAVTLTY